MPVLCVLEQPVNFQPLQVVVDIAEKCRYRTRTGLVLQQEQEVDRGTPKQSQK